MALGNVKVYVNSHNNIVESTTFRRITLLGFRLEIMFRRGWLFQFLMDVHTIHTYIPEIEKGNQSYG